RELQMLALAGPQFADISAENGDRHHHAGAGVANRRARFAGRTVFLAGDAHQPTDRLRDHVESETFLIRAAGAEAFDLTVDDRRIQRPDDIRAEAKTLDGTRGEVLDHHVGLLRHLLDEFDAAWVFQIDRDRPLVGVVLQKVIGVLTGLAAGGTAG